MSQTSGLVDKYVCFYTDGGWFAAGKVVVENAELYVIDSGPENLCIVHKNKVCISKMLTKLQFEEQHLNKSVTAAAVKGEQRRHRDSHAEELISTSESNVYGSFIPADMLEEGETIKDDDFGIFFGSTGKK